MDEIMSANPSYIFQNDLLSNEKILWAGQPELVWFTATDYFLIPFTLVAGGCGFAGIIAAILALYYAPATTETRLGGAVLVIPASILVLPMLFYLVIGRFFYKRWKNKNTYYAVTNQRVLVSCTAHGGSFQSIFINSLPSINKSIGKNGLGNLMFGTSPYNSPMLNNIGMEMNPFGSLQIAPAFYDIKDVNKVFELINDLRSVKT